MSSTIPEYLQPSIFETLCRDKLDDGLRPAFTDIARVFTRNSSRGWVRGINKYSDELFLVFYGILQFKYLFQYDATFGENFYGMKRVFYDSKKGKYFRLNNKQRIIALISILLFPYLRHRMDKKYQTLSEMTQFERETMYNSMNRNNNNNADSVEWQRKIDNLYLKYYKFFDALLELISFLFKINFLFINSKNKTSSKNTNTNTNNKVQNSNNSWSFAGYDNLLSWFLGQKTIRIDVKDLQTWKQEKDIFKSILFSKILGGRNNNNGNNRNNNSEFSGNSSMFGNNVQGSEGLSFMDKGRYLFLRLLYFLGNVSKLMTLSVLFGFRWVEWFFMEEDRLIQKRSLNVPEAPKILKHSRISHEYLVNGKCMLCNKQRTNSAVIPTGYVFCYNCIFPFVQENHCCPVTRMPCTAIQIRKIFESS